MGIIDRLFGRKKKVRTLQKQLQNVLGIKTGNISLYTTALSHRSVKESADENNERLEYLGDAILSAIVAD
ncbi:MAG TPA: ribonuclease III, partial [Segetibacter sp.]